MTLASLRDVGLTQEMLTVSPKQNWSLLCSVVEVSYHKEQPKAEDSSGHCIILECAGQEKGQER